MEQNPPLASVRRCPVFDPGDPYCLVFLSGTEKLGYNWQWYQIPQYIFTHDESGYYAGPLWEGLMVTLRISGVSLVLAFVIGLTTALFRLSHSFVAQIIARFYLEAIRNTPLLIQLFFIYFVLGPVLGINRMTSAILALSLFEGAYASEIFRAGIVSIRRGQWEAAYSLGLSSLRHLLLDYPAPGHPANSTTPDQPGHFADQRFGPGEHHRHLRFDHAGPGGDCRDLSHV